MGQTPHPYKMKVIQEHFPLENDATHVALYNLDLESIDRYGVAMSPVKLYESVALTSELVKDFPEFSESDTMLKLEYIRSAYIFVSVLHNIHKITGKLIFMANLNPLYRIIIGSSKEERHMGYSIIQITPTVMKKLYTNALQICRSLNSVATEKDYLELITILQHTYSLEQIWLLFTKVEYDEFKVFNEIPPMFLSTLLED